MNQEMAAILEVVGRVHCKYDVYLHQNEAKMVALYHLEEYWVALFLADLLQVLLLFLGT